MASVFALLILAFASSISLTRLEVPPDPMPRWLLGCWVNRAGPAPWAQRWTEGDATTMFGAAWVTHGDSVAVLDVMRLSATGDSLGLVTVPMSGEPESFGGRARPLAGGDTVALAPTVGNARLLFHRLSDDRVHQEVARTAGSAAVVERTYQRVPCRGLLRPASDEARTMDRLHRSDERAVVAGDADALEQLWTDDIVALAPGAPPRAGRGANAAAMRRSIAQSRNLITLDYRLRIDETHLVADHAIEWGRYEGRVRERTDTTVVTARGSMLRVIRRGSDGAWRVARTMFTVE